MPAAGAGTRLTWLRWPPHSPRRRSASQPRWPAAPHLRRSIEQSRVVESTTDRAAADQSGGCLLELLSMKETEVVWLLLFEVVREEMKWCVRHRHELVFFALDGS
jgi:hypothetical protein